jgi:DedD protein
MDERAKERVFGVVILVALAVIFIPMCFNTTVGDSVKLAREMPKAPEWPQAEELLLPTERLLPTAHNDIAPLMEGTSSIAEAEVTEFVPPIEPAVITEPPLTAAPVSTVEVVAVPAADPVTTVAVVAPTTKVPVAAAPVAKVTKIAPKVAQKTLPIQKPAVRTAAKKESKPLMAYTIQLGNFENQANAQKLARSLRAAGYTAYVADNYSHGKDLTKVMVGPHTERRAAEKVASNLENQFKIKGFIVKYDPRN